MEQVKFQASGAVQHPNSTIDETRNICSSHQDQTAISNLRNVPAMWLEHSGTFSIYDLKFSFLRFEFLGFFFMEKVKMGGNNSSLAGSESSG